MTNKDENEFPKKWAKFLPDTFKDSAESMKTDDLKKEMYKAERVIVDLEKDMENDQKLAVLKEDVRALMGGYKDEIKTEMAKLRYCLYLIRDRGES